MKYFFDRILVFSDLESDQKELLRPIFVPRFDQEGTTIFRQGDPAQFLYLVVEGKVTIYYKPEDGPKLTLARVKPVGVVGWSSILGKQSYTCSAVCSSNCTLLRVCRTSLHNFCHENPETAHAVLERLATLIAERIRNTHTSVRVMLEQGLTEWAVKRSVPV